MNTTRQSLLCGERRAHDHHAVRTRKTSAAHLPRHRHSPHWPPPQSIALESTPPPYALPAGCPAAAGRWRGRAAAQQQVSVPCCRWRSLCCFAWCYCWFQRKFGALERSALIHSLRSQRHSNGGALLMRGPLIAAAASCGCDRRARTRAPCSRGRGASRGFGANASGPLQCEVRCCETRSRPVGHMHSWSLADRSVRRLPLPRARPPRTTQRRARVAAFQSPSSRISRSLRCSRKLWLECTAFESSQVWAAPKVVFPRSLTQIPLAPKKMFDWIGGL